MPVTIKVKADTAAAEQSLGKLEKAADFGRMKERVEGLKMAFNKLGGELDGVTGQQLKATAGALEFGEAGLKIGGPWGAAIGVVVGGLAEAAKQSEALKKQAEADFKAITAFTESAAGGLRSYQREIDRIIRGGDSGAIIDKRADAEERLADIEDRSQKIVDALQAKERALAEARDSTWDRTRKLGKAELELRAEYAASFDAIVKLTTAYEDQAAAVAQLKAAEAGIGTGLASGVSGLFGAITGAAGAAGAAIGAGAADAQKGLDKRAAAARQAAQEAADADAMMRRLVAEQDAAWEKQHDDFIANLVKDAPEASALVAETYAILGIESGEAFNQALADTLKDSRPLDELRASLDAMVAEAEPHLQAFGMVAESVFNQIGRNIEQKKKLFAGVGGALAAGLSDAFKAEGKLFFGEGLHSLAKGVAAELVPGMQGLAAGYFTSAAIDFGAAALFGFGGAIAGRGDRREGGGGGNAAGGGGFSGPTGGGGGGGGQASTTFYSINISGVPLGALSMKEAYAIGGRIHEVTRAFDRNGGPRFLDEDH